MLQSFRDNLKGTVATILVILIIIPFALFGVDSLFVTNSSANGAAEVNGEKISETELRRAVLLQKQRLEAQFGSSVPAEFISEERLRGPVLDSLVDRLVLAQEAANQGMAISETALDDLIIESPQFQEAGKFNAENYARILRNMGYTPAYYKRLLTQDVLLNQHSVGIADSGFVTDAELQRSIALSQQVRDFYYLTVPLAQVEEGIQISSDEVKAYYDEHNEDYLTEEKVKIEYLDISAQDLAQNVEVSEDAIRQQYDQEVQDFKSETRRFVSHILIEPKEDGSEEQLIDEIQNRLNAGESFADLAKQYSEDLGSKEQGGDLGFSTGNEFPEDFESALSELTVGEVSAPVTTESGIHFIRLNDIQGAEPPAFDSEKARIENQLRLAEGETTFSDILDKLEDLSYNAESLKEVADELGVALKTSEPFTRAGGIGVASESQVISSAYSDEVLSEGNTSEVLELGENRVVVLRTTDHFPSKVKPYEEVSSSIEMLLKRNKAKEAVEVEGKKLQDAIADGGSVEELAKQGGYQWQVQLDTRRTDPKVNRELLQYVFGLPKPASDKPVITGMHLNNGDFVVVSFTKAKDGKFLELAKEQKDSLQSRMEGQAGTVDFIAYQAYLKEEADIEIH